MNRGGNNDKTKKGFDEKLKMNITYIQTSTVWGEVQSGH